MDTVLAMILGGVFVFILMTIFSPQAAREQRAWEDRCVAQGGIPHHFRREDDVCLKPGTIIEVK